MDKRIFGDVDQYISDLFEDQDAALLATEKAIIDENIPQISISPNQGKFLQLMAKLSNAKKILEIGTLGGYSTIWMARALPKDGKLISLELEPHHAKVAGRNIANAGLADLVDIRIGKAIETLPQLVKNNEGPFDM